MVDDTDEPFVVCVLLNWNGWADTLLCLSALSRVKYANLQIVVVDNGSSDDSLERIRASAPNVPLLATGENLGFAGGNNVGIRHALEQQAVYIWLLNNDAEPEPSALCELVKKAKSDPKLGEIGSVLMYSHDREAIQAWGGGKVRMWSGTAVHAFTPQEDEWFDYLTAASVLLPRAALEDVGLLDDEFFLYWEDSDLSFRLRRNGWKLGVAAAAIVFHKEHGSTGGNRRLIDRYAIASGIRFLIKHSRFPLLSVATFLVLRIGRRFVTFQFRRIGDVIGGLRDFSRQVKR